LPPDFAPTSREDDVKAAPHAPPRERVSAELLGVGSAAIGTVTSAAATVASHLPGMVGVIAGAVATVGGGLGTWGATKGYKAYLRKRKQKGEGIS
jgi:hypothetical protein